MSILSKLQRFFERISGYIIFGLSCVIFLFLSIAGILQTSKIDPKNYVKEHILFINDNLLYNIFFMFLFLATLCLLYRMMKRISLKVMSLFLIFYVVIIGFIWVYAVQSVPAADSDKITSAARAFLNGDYSVLQSDDSYFRYFPFQLGFTFYCEIFFRLFGSSNYTAIAMTNVLALGVAYLALIKLSSLIFKNQDIVKLMILLLAGCFQSILFCSFIYGNIIGFSFSMWAVVFVTVYFKNRKKSRLVYAAVLIAAAVVAKPNYYIILAAICIILLVDCVKSRKLLNIAAVILAVTLTLSINRIIICSYESKADIELGNGVPSILWAAMGLQESDMAPGWYNHYTIQTFSESGYNSESAVSSAWMNISDRLSYFLSNPQYMLSFFTQKILSQWNEPTYESIWVSKTKIHLSEVPAFADDIYNNELGIKLEYYFNIYQQLILIGFLVSMIKCFKTKDIAYSFIPLIILGGFFYHLIFEAKSQYVLVYFVLLIPYAAFGLHSILEGIPYIKKHITTEADASIKSE